MELTGNPYTLFKKHAAREHSCGLIKNEAIEQLLLLLLKVPVDPLLADIHKAKPLNCVPYSATNGSLCRFFIILTNRLMTVSLIALVMS